MSWEQAFQIANAGAFFAWLALLALPRSRPLTATLRYGVVGALALAYAALAARYLPAVDGAGFTTLAGIKALLSSEPALLIGWLHYLAFDLFVGLWIAERADEQGWTRLAQAPVLLLTFMLGPVGLLSFYLARGVQLVRSR